MEEEEEEDDRNNKSEMRSFVIFVPEGRTKGKVRRSKEQFFMAETTKREPRGTEPI